MNRPKKVVQTTTTQPKRAQRPRRRRQTQTVQRTVTVVQPPPRRGGRRRPRRRGQRSLGDGPTVLVPIKFFISVKSNSVGTIKLGPNLEQAPQLQSLLKVYQRYRIETFGANYRTAASSTDRGTIDHHLDTSCKSDAKALKTATGFQIHANGSKSYGRNILGDKPWYESSEEQAWWLYKGSETEATTAGKIQFNLGVRLSNPL